MLANRLLLLLGVASKSRLEITEQAVLRSKYLKPFTSKLWSLQTHVTEMDGAWDQFVVDHTKYSLHCSSRY